MSAEIKRKNTSDFTERQVAHGQEVRPDQHLYTRHAKLILIWNTHEFWPVANRQYRRSVQQNNNNTLTAWKVDPRLVGRATTYWKLFLPLYFFSQRKAGSIHRSFPEERVRFLFVALPKWNPRCQCNHTVQECRLSFFCLTRPQAKETWFSNAVNRTQWKGRKQQPLFSTAKDIFVAKVKRGLNHVWTDASKAITHYIIIIISIIIFLPHLCTVFIYLKQTKSLGHMALQLFCIYNPCYM